MHVFEYVAYAMLPDEKKGELDAKDTKCLCLDYCEGTNFYRLIQLQIKKYIKIKDKVSLKDNMGIGNDLEMRLSGRSKTS